MSLIGVCFWTRRPESLVMTQVVLAGIMVVPALKLMLQACAGSAGKPGLELMWEMTCRWGWPRCWEP